MNCYLVVSPNVDDETLAKAFADFYTVPPKGAWVVASALGTSADVCNALGLTADLARNRIVVRLDDYYGFHNKDLWDRIAAWRTQ